MHAKKSGSITSLQKTTGCTFCSRKSGKIADRHKLRDGGIVNYFDEESIAFSAFLRA
jgi:hypothetical protein